jgi:hypothetical protein
MKTIVAGSRDYNNYKAVASVLDRCPWLVTEVVCGEARGPDTLGRKWGETNEIHVESFPADWDEHGKTAGHIRNLAMAQYSEACVIFWDGQSKGTMNMINHALSNGLHMLVVRV